MKSAEKVLQVGWLWASYTGQCQLKAQTFGTCKKSIIIYSQMKFYVNELENFNYLNVAFISYKLTMWD